jgi:2-oxoglutarate ferredoxin oxidoreductase subunit delta
MAIKVETEWCKGCGVCIDCCPVAALVLSKEMNKKGYFPPEMKPNNKCNDCRLCELICPDLAIGVIKEEDQKGKDGAQKAAEISDSGGQCD